MVNGSLDNGLDGDKNDNKIIETKRRRRRRKKENIIHVIQNWIETHRRRLDAGIIVYGLCVFQTQVINCVFNNNNSHGHNSNNIIYELICRADTTFSAPPTQIIWAPMPPQCSYPSSPSLSIVLTCLSSMSLIAIDFDLMANVHHAIIIQFNSNRLTPICSYIIDMVVVGCRSSFAEARLCCAIIIKTIDCVNDKWLLRRRIFNERKYNERHLRWLVALLTHADWLIDVGGELMGRRRWRRPKCEMWWQHKGLIYCRTSNELTTR